MFSRLSRWKTRLGYGWHRFKMRHIYWVVEQRDGKVGYVSFGDLKAVKHFAPYYLGSAEDVVIRRKWRCTVLREPHLRLVVKKYGLAVTTDKFLSASECKKLLVWPRSVALVADLPDSIDKYLKSLSRSAKSDLKLINRHGLSMKVSRESNRLKEFYHEFYQPSGLGRHGKDAHIYSWDSVLGILEGSPKSELIEVWCAGEWIGGVLCETDSQGVHLRRLGWLNGDMRYYSLGVLGALYWFAANRAIQSGQRRLLFGEVHSYLENGLFFFKTKWGGRLSYRHSNYGSWLVAVDPSHRDCRAFFDHYSLLMKSDTSEKFNVLSGRPQNEVKQASAHEAQIGEWYCLDELPHG